MATAAEMRARLAKYKLPQNTEEVSDVSSRELIKVPAQSSVADTRNVPSPSVRVEASASDSTAESAVRTDVQPTTLVVVERPVESQITESQDSDSSAAKSATNLDTTNPVHVNFLQRLADLEAAFLARDPLMKTHLKVIHTTMMDYEEIANLLTVQEISQIMAAQQVHTNTVLKQDVLKTSKAKANAKAAQLGLNDI